MTSFLQVQSDVSVCSFCQKICKSKGGLKRHMTAKHKNIEDTEDEEIDEESNLTMDDFATVVNCAINKIAGRKVYTQAMRDEIKAYKFEMDEESTEFTELKTMYKSLSKNGDVDKFYSKYYGSVALHATQYFKNLSRNSATLLSTKIADQLLANSKKLQSPNPCDSLKKMSEKEKAGLQYLGGYVLQKLHNKYSTSKEWKSSESQQAISTLEACKEKDKDKMESQRLISAVNRGGLWSPTIQAQTIFLKTENHFRDFSNSNQCQRSMDFKKISQKSAVDPDVVSCFNTIVSEASLNVNSSISKDILYSIINLYVRVRSFSFTKDIIQKYKIKQKKNKSKALRKEIQRASSEIDDRQP